MKSRFTRHYNINNTPPNWVTDTEDSHADHSCEVGSIQVEDYADWANELWACYAGDDRPTTRDRHAFVTWIGDGGARAAAKLNWV